MAKKKTTTRKSAKKSAPKTAPKTAPRGAAGNAKKSASRPLAKKAGRSAAKSTTTAAKPARPRAGKGPAASEIGRDLVTLVNLGKAEEAISKWYHAQIESVEGDGQSWKGMKALRAKNAWWYSTNELHSCQAEGPYSGATGFAVRYTMAFTPKGGQRTEMSEVGVYTVRNGKIVREEYMYAG